MGAGMEAGTDTPYTRSANAYAEAQAAFAEQAAEARNAYKTPIIVLTVVLAAIYMSLFPLSNIFARRLLLGAFPLVLTALTVLVWLRTARIKQTLGRSRTWGVKFMAVVCVVLAMMYVPAGIRTVRDLPYIVQPLHMNLENVTMRQLENTNPGSMQIADFFTGHGMGRQYSAAIAAKTADGQHIDYSDLTWYAITEQDFQTCLTVMDAAAADSAPDTNNDTGTSGDTNADPSTEVWARIAYIPSTMETTSITCTIGEPPVTMS